MDLNDLKKNLLAKGRLTDSEALKLFESDDLHWLGELAESVSVERNGDLIYFCKNRHLNPTNICDNRCRFCAFSRSPGDADAYELTVREAVEKAVEAGGDITELHIVGGLNPRMDLGYYSELFSEIKRTLPGVSIKALTAVEIDYLARKSKISARKVLETLKASGLDTMPGGGAEILGKSVRDRLCPEKIPGKRWLQIMRYAHETGVRTNATMLFGHVETYRDRVDHLSKLRKLQDDTGGFLAFIPLPFHPKNTHLVAERPISGIDILKTIAISRLYLDNLDNVKSYWIMAGIKLAQLALTYGANDMEGTVIEEKITKAAGGDSGGALGVDEIVRLIRKAGKTPVERDSFYNNLKVYK